MNKKPTILAVGVLGSLALIGTGFAGWVITATASQTANGSITAYTVADNRVFIDNVKKWDGHATTDEGWENGAIRFGKPSNYALTTSENGSVEQWLTAVNVDDEKLSAVYTFTGKFTNTNLVIDAKYSITGDNVSYYTSAITKEFIKGPTAGSEIAIEEKPSVNVATEEAGVYYTVDTDLKDGSALTSEGNAADGTLRHNFVINVYWVFHWGAHFGGDHPQNPFAYYNAKEADSVYSGAITNADDASASLADLAKANAAAFSFTFKLSTNDNTNNG